MRSVLENDQQTIDEGRLIAESISQGISGFTPSLIMKNLVNDYQRAKQLYGETIIRELTGYEPDYVEKNLNIPEFRNVIEQKIHKNIAELKERGMLDKHRQFTPHAINLAAIILYTEELDRLRVRGHGEQEERRVTPYGAPHADRRFTRGTRYRDIALKRSIRTAIRRGHTRLIEDDLTAIERRRQGRIHLVYALDASGSMRGEKLATAKKAGIALAYRAMEQRNKAGLIVFSSEIEQVVEPTRDFMHLIYELAQARAHRETDITLALEKALELFPRGADTKHLVLLTDAMPTRGKDPHEATLRAVSAARAGGITTSLIGIGLEEDAEELARSIAATGGGRLYLVRQLEALDSIMLEEYDAITR